MSSFLLVEDGYEESETYGAIKVNEDGLYEIAHERDSKGEWKFIKTGKVAELPETVFNPTVSGI